MDCKDLCLLCNSPQKIKVNYSQYHGICTNHPSLSDSFLTCFHCQEKVPIFNTCSICLKKINELVLSCCSLICKTCESQNFYCPSCFKCEVCLTNKYLTKGPCEHILCQACVEVACAICESFKIKQVESIEYNQESNIFFEDSQSIGNDLLKSEIINSNPEEKYFELKDEELKCESLVKDQKDLKGKKDIKDYNIALVIAIVVFLIPMKIVLDLLEGCKRYKYKAS